MNGPRRNGSWKATSHAYQMNLWRLDAVKWRDQAAARFRAMNASHALVVKAIELLDADDPANARLHLLDALRFLATDD